MIKKRITAVMVGCIILGGAILGRAIQLQVVKDPRLESLARRQFQSKVLLRPRRGAILDRNGEALAVNVEIQSLAANPSKIRNKKILARLLAKSIDIPYSRLYDRLKGKREFIWLKRHLSENELGRLKKYGIIDSDGDLTAGMWMVKESNRVFPHGELAAHVLGSVNLDSEGLEGVELWANERLQGKVVSVTAVKDALGRPTFIDAAAAKNVKEGESVTLTIDASLQFAVEQELRNAVIKTGSRSGSVVVMNAVNGEILAMANEPSFNPNQKGTPPDRRRNRALTDGYEPGSILKPVLIASALTNGWKLTDSVYGERGSFVVQGKRISEAEAHEKFEWINLKQIIKVSSNVGAAKVALKLGADRYYSTLKTFGFGAKTDTGFPGEISGIVPPRKSWQPLTLANIGFGHGVLVTPMQMVRSYATFLNGGWLVQPTLLKNDMKGMKTDPPKRILTQKVADGVVEAMKGVTEDKGTGIKARLEGYTVAGKTGTAQVVDSNTGKYSRSRYIASFVGFAVGVDPKLVIFTSLDEPHGVYYASDTAAPLFHQILNAAANRFSLPTASDPSRVLAATSPKGAHPGKLDKAAQKAEVSDRLKWSLAKVASGVGAGENGEPADSSEELHWQGTTPEGDVIWKMPSLAGLTPREAIQSLKGHRFKMEVHGTGVVHSQVPETGKPLQDGGTIRLNLTEP